MKDEGGRMKDESIAGKHSPSFHPSAFILVFSGHPAPACRNQRFVRPRPRGKLSAVLESKVMRKFAAVFTFLVFCVAAHAIIFAQSRPRRAGQSTPAPVSTNEPSTTRAPATAPTPSPC